MPMKHSISCQNNSTIRVVWRALESATLTMKFSLLLSLPLHSLPTLTLQPIQLWLEKPLGFQSLQSFDHNEFQSLPSPTLCSHLYSNYKEVSAEWRDKEWKALIEREVFSKRITHTELCLGLKMRNKINKLQLVYYPVCSRIEKRIYNIISV